ncbi:LppX_LprAFG lipoprotein [Chloroflexota bacterium]
MKMHNITKLCLFIMLILVLTGCGKSEFNDLTAAEIISSSTERMTSLKGFEFIIERSGESVFLDDSGIISFKRAEGQFNAPDEVFAMVRVIGPGLVTEVQIISIAGQQWETNFLTGDWQEANPLYSFNPSILFDANQGIQSILANELESPILQGLGELAELPGKELYLIEATTDGARAHDMSLGMIDKETIQVKLWIDPDTFDLHRIKMIDPINPGQAEDTIWQIDFWNFDTNFKIEQPILDE